MSELRRIPGVGKETEKDLLALGYATIESLRDQDPEEIYRQDCRRRGVVYFASTEHPDPEKLQWWKWKDIR